MPTISERIVKELPVPEKGNRLYYFSHARLQGRQAPSGFAVRCTAAGSKSFVWFHRVNGQSHLETIGRWSELPTGDSLSVVEAITAVQKRAKAVRDGAEDARPERTKKEAEKKAEIAKPVQLTVKGLIDAFLARYVRGRLRTAVQIEGALKRLVEPAIGDVSIYDLKRSQVAKMLDTIADDHGEVMADRTLAYTRKAFNWYEVNGHDDDFRSPIVNGMGRTKPSERARKRKLTDDELRDLWAALDIVEAPACFPPLIKTLLLTACRRSDVSDMHSSELDGDLWTIPGERYKTGLDHVVPLTPMALEMIGTMPTKPFIFSTTGGTVAFANFSKSKTALDKAIAVIRERDGRAPMAPWTFHDLRRTARSLMSRAKVPSDYAERCLGHVMGGVRGVYDRFEYLDEKKAAFEALSAMVASIVLPEVQ